MSEEMMDDTRPAWKHEIPEETARWLWGGFITKITHHSEMTGADTAKDWIELHKASGKRAFPSSFLSDNGYWTYRPNWRELVQPTYRGEQAIKDLEAIDKWEAANRRDRAEFERLKKKFASPA